MQHLVMSELGPLLSVHFQVVDATGAAVGVWQECACVVGGWWLVVGGWQLQPLTDALQ